MNFDPDREPAPPRIAGSVILLRARPSGEAEVFLLRRHRKSSFMASSYVFPGGTADPEDADDPRATAARELFEEAGVLISDPLLDAKTRADLRAQLEDAATTLTSLLTPREAALALDGLVPFSHWITPSAEAKRFSARFFLAELPAGQTPSFDNKETVDELWATPSEALARATELRLPPPQIRTLMELQDVAPNGPKALLGLAAQRGEHATQPILPRLALLEEAPNGFALLLPWDPEYDTLGTGEARPLSAGHPSASGPSRFVLDDSGWRNVSV